MTNLIVEAARFAARKHEGQVRRFSQKPYITHPQKVASRAMILRDDNGYVLGEMAIVAAYLHDVLEDTPCSREEMEEAFGPIPTQIVVDLTNTSKRDHPEMDRPGRKQIDRERIKKGMHVSRILKLIDRIENMTDLIDDARHNFRAADFLTVYAPESLLLAEALAGTWEPLELELRLCVFNNNCSTGRRHNQERTHGV